MKKLCAIKIIKRGGMIDGLNYLSENIEKGFYVTSKNPVYNFPEDELDSLFKSLVTKYIYKVIAIDEMGNTVKVLDWEKNQADKRLKYEEMLIIL